MEKFTDIYYPYDSIIDFFSGGYALNLAGLHLTVAYMMILIASVVCGSYNRWNTSRTVSNLYFALQPFNNAAFSAGGINIADACGAIIGMICIFNFLVKGIRVNDFLIFLFAFIAVATFHGLLVWVLNPEFVDQAPLAARYLIVAKVFVMILVLCWIYNTQDPTEYLDNLTRSIALFTLVCCLVYIAQIVIFTTGTVPYGSFAGAGYSTTVAFGGVSIERGHLSKFMAPLFAPLLIDAYLRRRKWIIGLYLFIMLINFSASGLSFLLIQALICGILFWKNVRRYLFHPLGLLAQMAFIALLAFFSSAYGAIIAKIYRLVLLGDETDQGGRSITLLLTYLRNYPFGIGYSGSTYRTAPELPEMNMGIYAFISQLSIISVYYIFYFIGILSFVFYKISKDNVIGRILLVSSLSTPFVFFADTLWFLPLWWIGIFWLLSYGALFHRRDDNPWAHRDGFSALGPISRQHR